MFAFDSKPRAQKAGASAQGPSAKGATRPAPMSPGWAQLFASSTMDAAAPEGVSEQRRRYFQGGAREGRAAPVVQAKPKLDVSEPSDPLEIEADRMADAVMRSAGAAAPPVDPSETSSVGPGALQRACAGCESAARGRDDDEERGEGVKVHAKRDGCEAPSCDAAESLSALSSGEPLPEAERSFFEPRFGFDFSDVRVHAGAEGDRAARAIQARAFTTRKDIGFASGEYAPGTTSGRRLLAHELTHVVQQSGSARGRTSRALVQRACGPAAIGTVAGCTGLDGEIAGPEFLFVVGCDTFRTDTPIPEERRLRSQAALIPNGISIDLHGYASEEGSVSFNEELSCARAQAAARVLTSELATLGKTVSVNLYKHGATPGPRPLRRSVVLHYVAATPVPPAPPGLTVVPCSPLPKHLLTRGACGSGADFAFHDFPTLSWGDAAKVAFARVSTNFALQNNMRTELGILGGSEGLRMVTQFSSGTGATLTHGPTTPIGSAALGAASFTGMHAAAGTNLQGQLTGMAASGTVDCNALTLASSTVPFLSFTFSDGWMLKGIIGGTQGLTVWLDSFSVTPGTRNYSMTLRYVICDDFGVDTSDLYSPALISFWVLQHERTGFVPFQNVIDLSVTRTGTF